MSPTTFTPSAANQASSNPAASTTATTNPLASESTFLTLLVSQLQNQDPLNPTDSTEFVSQLTSYSQLEQLINIDKNTAPAETPAKSGTGAAPHSTSSDSISTTGI
jgi:flagellar basal-body rod modification protein FlgD